MVAAKRKIILVVDDDKDIKNVVKSALEKEGYRIIKANDGDDCLKKLKLHKDVALILLDIMMPGTPVRKIVPKIKGVKIAYLSIVQTTEAEREYLLKQKNVVGFIQKPFEIDELISEVNSILRK